MKRNYQQFNETPVLNMEGIHFQDFSAASQYYSPPIQAQQQILFSHPFNGEGGYIQEGFIPSSEAGYYSGHRSLSEPFIHNAEGSFGQSSNSSASSSCGTSCAPNTPPPVQFSAGPTKYPAVPITPSHHVPRQKAKRTATACEECRKRKQKCDGESPCQACKEQKLECKYREVSPTKKDNSIERLVSLVENCSRNIEAMNARLDEMNAMIRIIETRLSRCFTCGSKVEMESGHCNSCNPVQCRL